MREVIQPKQVQLLRFSHFRLVLETKAEISACRYNTRKIKDERGCLVEGKRILKARLHVRFSKLHLSSWSIQ